MRILYVCTANICRSASAQRLLRDAVAAAPELAGVEVRSAGTAAFAGFPGCTIAPALIEGPQEHRSQPLTAELVGWADLILPAARDHRPAIMELAPTTRTRTFTMRQAGRIASWMVDSGMVAAGRQRQELAGSDGVGLGEAWAGRFPVGDPRRDVQALPDDPAGRTLWLVSEMDAARGLAGASPALAAEAEVERRRGLRRGRGRRERGRREQGAPDVSDQMRMDGGWSGDPQNRGDVGHPHPDDVPDPHVLGAHLHPLAYEEIRTSTEALVRLLREVVSAG